MDCKICYENYDDYSRKPYFLYPCGHTYCKCCLDSLVRNICPECNMIIQDKKVNYALIKPNEQTSIETIKAKLARAEISKNILQEKILEAELEHVNTVKKLTSELKAKTDLIVKEVLKNQEKLLNDISIVSSDYNNSLNELKKTQKLIALKLENVKELANGSLNLELLDKKLKFLEINSKIEMLSIYSSTYLNQISKIDFNDLFFKPNEDIIAKKFAQNYFDQGLDSLKRSKLENAVDLMSKAIALKHDFTQAYYFKGHSLCRLNKFEEAIKCFDKSLEIDPFFLLSYNFKGYALDCMHKKDEAKTFYELALGLNKTNLNVSFQTFNRAFSLFYLGKHDEALKLLDLTIRLDSENASFYYFKSVVLHFIGNQKESIECSTEAIDLNPNYDLFYSHRATVLESTGELDDALKCLDKAFDLNPKCYAGFITKLRILFNSKRYNECIETANKVIKIDNEFICAYDYKAKSLEKLDANIEALSLSFLILEKEKYVSDYFKYHLLRLVELKKHRDALKYANKGLLITNEKYDMFLYFIQLECLTNLKRYQEALETSDLALKICQEDDEIFTYDDVYTYKYDALVGLKEKRKAAELLSKVKISNSNNESVVKKMKKLIYKDNSMKFLYILH